MQRYLRLWILILTSALLLSACDMFMSADARVQKAQQQIAANDYRAAVIELKNALQDEPDHRQARLLLAQASLQLGDVSEAEKELRRAVELGTPAEEAADLMARVRLEAAQYRELLAQIDAGELPLPEPQRSTYRGRALLGLEQAGPAMEAFKTALAADPQFVRAQMGVAEATAALGDTEKALEQVQALLANGSVAAQAWALRGTILVGRGDFAGAEEALQAARKAPRQLTVRQEAAMLVTLTEVQLAKGDATAASATQQQLKEVAPEAPVTRLLGARISMSKQDYTAAVAELQRLVATATDFTPARFLLGVALMAQGNFAQSEAQLAQVVARAPENLEARKLLAQVRMRLDRPEAAIQALLPAQSADSGDAQVELMLGAARMQMGDLAAALAHLERTAASSSDRNVQLELAATYLRAGQADRAIEVLQKIGPKPGDLRHSALLVTALANTRGVAAARAEVDRLLAAQPKEPGVLNLAAAFHAQQHEFDTARNLLERSAALDPKNTAPFLMRARVEALANDLPAARRALDQALGLDPDNGEVRMALASVALRAGDPQAAIASLDELRKRDAAAIEPRLLLMRIYLERKQTRQADELATELTTLAQGRADVINAIGNLFLSAGRYDEALSRFRSATELDGSNPGFWLNVARAQLALDQAPGAREALTKALAAKPDWVPAVGALALLDVRDRKPDAALARIAALKQSKPQDAAVAALEGDVLVALQQYREAAAAYDRAATLGPSRMIAVKEYRARERGNLPDAAAVLERWLVRQPDDALVRSLLAEAYQHAGQTQRAIQQYEQVVRNGPPAAVMLNNLAWLYHENGDARAAATAQRAYELAPQTAAIADTYGWILVESGNLEQGLKILQQAVRLDDKNPDIGYHFAAALARTGDKAGARSRLAALLEATAEFSTARQARQLLESLQGP